MAKAAASAANSSRRFLGRTKRSSSSCADFATAVGFTLLILIDMPDICHIFLIGGELVNFAHLERKMYLKFVLVARNDKYQLCYGLNL